MILDLVEDAVRAGARRSAATEIVGLSARSTRRWSDDRTKGDGRAGPKTAPAHRLTEAERAKVVATANSPEFRDMSPKQIVPKLADRGVYIASESSFYRVLHAEGLMKHREHAKPAQSQRPKEYVASEPGQVWTWDITYLRAPVRGTFYYLYLVLDVYSRKIVVAKVHEEESMELSSDLVKWALEKEDVDPRKLVIHADNGGPMKGSTMLATLQRLGIVASFSRPSVSDDNPYVESIFRTLKYRPGYPRKPFASLAAATEWVDAFVSWYNTEHLHSAIRFVTPEERHEGRDFAILAERRKLYSRARAKTPRRWTGGTRNWTPIGAVVLNPIRREARGSRHR
jgi:transposase InsO family protein